MEIEQESLFTKNFDYLVSINEVTRLDLGKSLGITPDFIRKLRNGSVNNPSLNVLIAISNYFNIHISDLISTDLEALKDIGLISIPIYCLPQINKGLIKIDKLILSGYSKVPSVFKDCFGLFLKQGIADYLPNTTLFINNSPSFTNLSRVLCQNILTDEITLKVIKISDEIYLDSIIPNLSTLMLYDEKTNKILGEIIGKQTNKGKSI